MPRIAEFEGNRFEFPDNATDTEIAAALSSLAPASKQSPASKGFLGGVADYLGKLSLADMAKAAYAGATAPGRAAQGGYTVQPETPGQWSEADEFRQRLANEQMQGDVGKLAGVVMSPVPGAGPPVGSLGSRFARPGAAAVGEARAASAASPAAVAAPVNPTELLQAAGRIDVPIPRYMADDSRWAQGWAAGLQNIPGAGDKIAKAAEETFKGLGAAAQRVQQGYGAGSPAVAGSASKDALAEWMTTGSSNIASRAYDAVDNLVNPEVRTGLTATAQIAQGILARRRNAKIPGASGAVNVVADAIAAPGGMNYAGIKDLRSYIGDMTPQEIVQSGLKSGEVKQLYGALTTDLKTAIRNAGGEPALTAWQRANSLYDSIVDRRKSLTKIIGLKADAAPEAVYQRLIGMAGSKGGADIGRLVLARKTMGSEAWDEVTSALISRLGRDPTGEFSVVRFLGPNGFSGLSPQARQVLFRSTGKIDLAKQIEDLAFVSRGVEEKLKQFRNPSGTGRSVAATSMVMDVLHHPIRALATILGGNRIAKSLATPATVEAMATWKNELHAAIMKAHGGSPARLQAAASRLVDVLSSEHGINPAALAGELQLINQSALGMHE